MQYAPSFFTPYPPHVNPLPELADMAPFGKESRRRDLVRKAYLQGVASSDPIDNSTPPPTPTSPGLAPPSVPNDGPSVLVPESPQLSDPANVPAPDLVLPDAGIPSTPEVLSPSPCGENAVRMDSGNEGGQDVRSSLGSVGSSASVHHPPTRFGCWQDVKDWWSNFVKGGKCGHVLSHMDIAGEGRPHCKVCLKTLHEQWILACRRGEIINPERPYPSMDHPDNHVCPEWCADRVLAEMLTVCKPGLSAFERDNIRLGNGRCEPYYLEIDSHKQSRYATWIIFCRRFAPMLSFKVYDNIFRFLAGRFKYPSLNTVFPKASHPSSQFLSDVKAQGGLILTSADHGIHCFFFAYMLAQAGHDFEPYHVVWTSNSFSLNVDDSNPIGTYNACPDREDRGPGRKATVNSAIPGCPCTSCYGYRDRIENPVRLQAIDPIGGELPVLRRFQRARDLIVQSRQLGHGPVIKPE